MKTAQISGPERKPKAKPRGRPFRKGQSGNPGGRPKDEREVVEALRLEGTQLVASLLKLALARVPNVRAIEVALDRAYGKAKQDVTFTGKISTEIDFDKLPEKTALRAAALLQELEALIGEPVHDD